VTGADIISAASGLPRSTLLSMHPGVPHRAAAHLLNAWHEQRAREVHTAMREATSGANAPGTLLGLGQALSRPSDSTTSLLAGIDMRPLYSAVHIHQVCAPSACAARMQRTVVAFVHGQKGQQVQAPA
jgi:hypothetical protein